MGTLSMIERGTYTVNVKGTMIIVNFKGMLNVQSILGAIAFLLSDQSKYSVGQNIIVDDGFSL